MFFCLLPVVFSSVVEIRSEAEGNTYIGGEKYVFAKFHKTGCESCEMMAEEFEKTSDFFSNVSFIAINCMTIEAVPLCWEFEVHSYPTLMVFSPKSRIGDLYSGDRSSDTLADFLEEKSGIIGIRPPPLLKEVNQYNFKNSIEGFNCTYITYYTPWCKFSQRYMPKIRKVAHAFRFEESIRLANVNCEKFRDFCVNMGVIEYPSSYLYLNSVKQPQEALFEVKDIVNYLNEKCGFKRQENGILNDSAGTIPEADALVRDFLNSKSFSTIELMNSIPHASFYVFLMKKYIQDESSIQDIKEKILKAMNGQLSASLMDSMKTKLNIIRMFENKITEL